MQESPSKETLVVFRQVWQPASTLSELPSINPASAREAARALESIHAALIATPHPELHLTQPIIAHLHKALFRVLGLCTGFFLPEKRFDFLMDPWCKCLGFLLQLTDGYDLILASDWRADLTLLNVLLRIVLGYEPANKPTSQAATPQSVDPTTTPKDRMADETRLLAVQCLIHAIPLDESTPGIHDLAQQDGVLDDTFRAPSSDLVRWRTKSDQWVRDHLLGPDRQSRETFASLLCILPDTVKNAQLVALRVAALDGLMKLLRCLGTPERIGNNFPGLIFRLDAAAKERGLKENHIVLTKMLDIWTFMVVHSLKGLASTATNLKLNGDGLAEDLMSMYNNSKRAFHASSSSSSSPSKPEPIIMDYGTDAWLAAMAKGLRLHFKDISPLRTHAHWMVRLKFGEMAFNILKDCQASIKRLGGGRSTTIGVTGFLLETLLGCTLDDYRDVCQPTRDYLRQLMEEYESTYLINIAKEILRERLIALPRVLHGVDEALKQSSVRLVQGIVVFLGKHMENMINHQTLVGYIQPWINLLTIEQLDQHNMDERGGVLGDGSWGAQDPDTGSDIERWNSWVQSRKGSGRKLGFPRRIHLYLREQTTSTAFMGLLRQLGSTTEINVWTEELTTRLRQDCQHVRESQGWFDARTVSSVLLLNQVLLGAYGAGLANFGKMLTTEQSTKKKVSSTRKQLRHARRAAKGVLEEYLEILVACSQMALEARSRQEAKQRADPSLDAEKDSRTKKALLAKMFGADDDEMFDMDVGAEAMIYDHNTDVMLQCLLLEGIASIAVILGSEDFEMELYRTLYILLEQLGDQESALVRDTAEACLEHVAFVCQYESIGDLIQANYDYVIQQVSQRIVFLGTNPKTPQVLCALIRVVGPPAIAMLEDSVTEIFEALDHWKSQEDEVGEGLLKSLCEIVHVMALAVEASDASLKTDQKNSSAASKRDSGILMMLPGMEEFSHSDKASVEVAEFARRYRVLVQEMSGSSQAEADAMEEEMKDMTPEQIRDYFLRLTKDAEQEQSTLTEDAPADTTDDPMEKMLKEAAGEESLSLDELRDAIPKPPPKDAEPEPPTKHEQLCLRILDKAGYFLTSDSPRMRILALEAIQRAIVVLRDRPTELNPAIHAFWPAMVSRVLMRRSNSTEVFYVSLRAIEVVTALAENCSEFLSRHLMNDVWPFILKALQSWTQKPATADRAHRRTPLQTITVSQGSGGRTSQPMRSQGRRAASTKVFTREHRLQLTTLASLGKIVRRVRVPVREVWPMLLLARDIMLDQFWTLHWDVRAEAAEVMKSMASAGHGDSVYLALEEVVKQSASASKRSTAAQDAGEAADEEDGGVQLCSDVLSFMEAENL
ncbi:TEL2-interacting protein 1 [Mortierella alpina]|nr:TEL2-interacting protein 1 [Mortierella alpina]